MKLTDIKIMGDGSVGGGTYGTVKIMGNGRVGAHVDAQLIKVMGNGELRSARAKEITVAGYARFDGDVSGGEFNISGSTQVNGDIKVETITVNGDLKGKNVEAESFVSRGVFHLETLNAGDVKITPGGRSKVKEIGAENIDVSQKGFWGALQWFTFGVHHNELVADIIEADRIYLERTVAKSVKGNHVTIGPGCKIDLVEFKDSVQVDKDARVEKTVQV
ncbi:MAG TPA: hypothetical protein VNU93_09970 [Verrucomicrobiae bacterium]|nr:hypothetical protein [Verrucomicrobiae bacterium]